MKTLPSFQGEYEAQSNIRKLPSHKKYTPPTMDMINLSALLATPIKCTLPLADILRVKPELWKDVGKCLEKMGIHLPATKTKRALEAIKQTRKVVEPIPVNKVGDYCKGEDGNTTIPVEFVGQTNVAIIDSGAGVAIATKNMWEAWGKPALTKTRMKLQLADGFIERPLGLLEKIVVTSYGVEYEHTFAVVDFGKDPNYDIIFDRPFMRQLKMIQDWGFNYIYLRQQEAITRVNLKNHSYKDVAQTPVEDFESATTDNKSTIPSWANAQTHLWMCGASDTDSLLKDQCTTERDARDDTYIPEPFPEDEFKPIE